MRIHHAGFLATRLAGIVLMLALALGSGAASGKDDAPDTIGALRLIGTYTIPTGTLFDGVEFGGISGIDRAPDGRYWAISDDRGGERGTPRFYALQIGFDLNAFHHVNIEKMVYLRGTDGQVLSSAARTVDPEGIRLAPNGHLYISSEGNWSATPGALFQPFVREFRTDGSFVRNFDIPPAFHYVDNTTSGGRSNKLFEALARTPDGTLFTANEDALIQDGPTSSLHAGSVLRVLKLDPASGQTVAQYAYALPRIPMDQAPASRFPPDNGLTELLAVSDTEFIALERAYADGVGNTIRLVLTRIEPDTTDVSDLKSLVNASYRPMSRRLLLEMPITHEGVRLDNMEGLSWGPRLSNGHRSLLLVSDNNFSPLQSTLFMAFEVQPGQGGPQR